MEVLPATKLATKEMRCRWIRQGCIISLVLQVLPATKLVNVYSTWESLDISYRTLNQPVLTRFAPVGQVSLCTKTLLSRVCSLPFCR